MILSCAQYRECAERVHSVSDVGALMRVGALLQEAIALWEELRRQDTPKEKREELVTQILKLIRGHIADVAASPKASRIIQSCVKHGSPAHRALIVKEVQPQVGIPCPTSCRNPFPCHMHSCEGNPQS